MISEHEKLESAEKEIEALKKKLANFAIVSQETLPMLGFGLLLYSFSVVCLWVT